MARKKPTLPVGLGDMPADLEHHVETVDTPTLSMAEMKEIEAQAREEVNKELKARLKADFLAKTKADLKKKALFSAGTNAVGDKLERVRIDLPKFSNRITLDGIIYLHGMTYDFTQQQAAVVKETINRQWLHHAEINGLDMNEYLGRQPKNEVARLG